MRHVLRQYLTRDPGGRPLSVHSERLTDDGAGHLQLRSERTALWCSGCRRPVSDLSELRGECDVCRIRGCCTHCMSRCQVCARRLCGKCRQGFAGPPPCSVCGSCRERLMERQRLQDEMLVEKEEFERHVARQRLLHQVEGLRLASEREMLTLRLQAARWGIRLEEAKPSILLRAVQIPVRGVRLLCKGLVWGIKYACRV